MASSLNATFGTVWSVHRATEEGHVPDQDDAPVADGDPDPMAAVMALLAPGAPFEMGTEKVPVSYTHLTLPTKA